MTAAGNPSEADDGSRLVMDELERQTLEAQKKYRRQAHELARLEEDAANKRIDLYSSASP